MQSNLSCNLAKIGWLSKQPADFQQRMFRLGTWTKLNKGRTLYGIAEEPEAIYGLDEGLLDVAIPIRRDEMVRVHRAAPGFWIGDSALLAETTRGVEISAAADCRIFQLSGQAVQRNLIDYPQD